MADVGETIGGYRLRSLLQTGAQSQVFEVVEPSSGRHFAMKVLLPEHSQSKDTRAMLFHEADVGIKMRHENVINISKVVKDDATPFFVMEFFPSGSLRQRLKVKDPKEVEKDKEFLKTHSRTIFKQMATGLAYMNMSGWVHRDVKPDNILVNATGQTKIIDFAITKKMESGFLTKILRARKPKRPQGTPSFMSPEQIRDDMLDGRADIYSYGATLFELTTGRPPFRGASQADLLTKQMKEKPLSPCAYNKDLTDEFGEFVLKLLAKKKEDRPETFHQVLIQLKKIRIYKSINDLEHEEEF